MVCCVPQFLWFMDDVLYPEHRSVPLHAPVFILAPPRTGSTSLHRALVSGAAALARQPRPTNAVPDAAAGGVAPRRCCHR